MRAPGLTLGFFLGLCAFAGAATAEVPPLSLPGKVTDTGAAHVSHAALRLPVGAWADGRVPLIDLSGALDQQAWRIEGASEDTLALLAQLTADLGRQGFTPIFSCATDACGGFDFRYQLPLLNEPDMHVDLGDFRYISAEKGGEALSLMISRATEAAFVQVTRVVPGAAPDGPPTVVAQPGQPAPISDLGAQLEAAGAVVLGDLVFASGKATLEPGDYPSLQALADYMAARPEAKVALVGHTDASGGLAGNVALSEARAGAVRKQLISLGIKGERIEAKGVGYLAPRASNLTPEGRTQNRRVEVMLTSTQVGAAP